MLCDCVTRKLLLDEVIIRHPEINDDYKLSFDISDERFGSDKIKVHRETRV